MAHHAPGRQSGDRPHAIGHPARSRLTAQEVRRLHSGEECPAWQTVVELVEMGIVEARADCAGLVRLYPAGVPA